MSAPWARHHWLSRGIVARVSTSAWSCASPLWLAASHLGVPPEACLYVGDDARDIEAAKAAGMPSVAALWGYREAHEDPRAWGATVDCVDAEALRRWLGGQGA